MAITLEDMQRRAKGAQIDDYRINHRVIVDNPDIATRLRKENRQITGTVIGLGRYKFAEGDTRPIVGESEKTAGIQPKEVVCIQFDAEQHDTAEWHNPWDFRITHKSVWS